jgi:4-hydroxy-tetrahydrodipicolinate reductase
MVKIAVSGSKGKMGSRIIELAKNERDITVSGTFDIGENAEVHINGCDCLIEFTTPEATMEHLVLCLKHARAIVIGTTGLSDAQKASVEKAAREIPIVFSPNMSVGVNLVFGLVEDAARTLGREYDVRIKEAHHVHKKDAPSGTAKELARIIRESRKGLKDVPVESVREGEIVGDHTVTFEGPLDRLEIVHSAKTRDIFAQGALVAAKFIVKKPRGLFTMRDVLSTG